MQRRPLVALLGIWLAAACQAPDASSSRILDFSDGLGLTPAMQAAARGAVDELADLRTRGSDLGAVNERTGATVLHYAAQATNGGAAVVEWLWGVEPELARELVNRRIPANGHTVAMEAVFNANAGVVDVLMRLRDAGEAIDFETTTALGWGPRTFAEREAMPFAARLPLSAVAVSERQAWLAEQDEAWGRSQGEGALRGVELLRAVQRHDVAAVDALLAEGLSVDGRYGRLGATLLNSVSTPGMSAEALASAAVMQRHLLERGADPLVAETGLMRVGAGFREATFGYATLVGALVEAVRVRGGDGGLAAFLNARGPMNGYTKLIDAALRGRADVVRVLVGAGADVRVAGFSGMTALDAARLYDAQHPEAPLPADVAVLLTPAPEEPRS